MRYSTGITHSSKSPAIVRVHRYPNQMAEPEIKIEFRGLSVWLSVSEAFALSNDLRVAIVEAKPASAGNPNGPASSRLQEEVDSPTVMHRISPGFDTTAEAYQWAAELAEKFANHEGVRAAAIEELADTLDDGDVRVDSETDKCRECGDGIHLDHAGSDMGVLEGASVWVHDRFYPYGMEPHDPFPVTARTDVGS